MTISWQEEHWNEYLHNASALEPLEDDDSITLYEAAFLEEYNE